MLTDDMTAILRLHRWIVGGAFLILSSNCFAAIPKQQPMVPTASALKTRVVADIENEHRLYGKILSAYQNRQIRDLENQVQLFEISYPQSVHLDNAYYLLGLTFFQRNLHSDALVWFNKVLEKTPAGNKTVAALLAKGFIYQQLGLPTQAQFNFRQVIERFPGSSESFQASTHLEILEKFGTGDLKGEKQ